MVPIPFGLQLPSHQSPLRAAQRQIWPEGRVAKCLLGPSSSADASSDGACHPISQPRQDIDPSSTLPTGLYPSGASQRRAWLALALVSWVDCQLVASNTGARAAQRGQGRLGALQRHPIAGGGPHAESKRGDGLPLARPSPAGVPPVLGG